MLILQTEQSFNRQVVNGMAIVTRSEVTVVGCAEITWEQLVEAVDAAATQYPGGHWKISEDNDHFGYQEAEEKSILYDECATYWHSLGVSILSANMRIWEY
mgnify:CR=1 FL=1